MIVSGVQQEDTVTHQHFTYAWDVLLGKNRTQQKVVVYRVETKNIVTQIVEMYVQ
jgi:hypothetical protein